MGIHVGTTKLWIKAISISSATIRVRVNIAIINHGRTTKNEGYVVTMENVDVKRASHLEKPSGRYRPQFSDSSCDSTFVV
jgi:hypothetical protein